MPNPTPLSPAAQAVIAAIGIKSWRESAAQILVRGIAAAALRAAADQVVPEGYTQAYDCCLEIMGEIRDDFLAIAAELSPTTTETADD